MSSHRSVLKGPIDTLRDRKNQRRDSVMLIDAGSPKKAVKFPGLGKHTVKPLDMSGLSNVGDWPAVGGKSGSKTERIRSHRHPRLDSLSAPNNRTMPGRPPTAAQAVLPGINNRYSRPVRTPAKERSAGERGGHAGMVTRRSRDMLNEEMVCPLLDMAAYSLNADTQNLVAPAMAALAGVASNRKVLSSLGAVDVMLRLAQGGKTVKVRQDAWEAILQLIQSSQACQRFFELDGLKKAMDCSNDSHAIIRRKAACVVARLLSKDSLKIHERVSIKNISGICAFVTSSDQATSLAAGSALLKIVRSAMEVTLKPETASLDQIVEAVCKGKSVVNLVSPDRTTINKGHSNALLALSILAQDKEICSRLARAEVLAKILKKLYEHGVCMGRTTSEEDVYFSRIIVNLCMTCRTHDLLSDHDVLMNLIAALPRMLLVLVEAMPRDTSNPFKSKSSSSAINPEMMLLPSEIELQHNLVLSIGRFMFCMTLARHHVLQTGFLPALIELSASRTIKVRQNAAICIFYLVQDKEVQEHFGKAPNERGVPMESPIKSLLGLLRLSHDLLVRLTVLRCVKALAHVSINVAEMEKMGISNDLQHSFEVANKQAIRDPHLMRSAQLFPVLKCAFCATDIVFLMDHVATEARKTDEGTELMKGVTIMLQGDFGGDGDEENPGPLTSKNSFDTGVLSMVKASSRRCSVMLTDEALLATIPPSPMTPGTALTSPLGLMGITEGAVVDGVGHTAENHEPEQIGVEVMEAAWESAWQMAGGLYKMAHESMLLYLDAFTDIAASAMAGGETKKHLEMSARRDTRAMQRLNNLEAAAHKHAKDVGHDVDRLRKIFKKYDEDESGEIDGDELYSILRDMGHLCTRDEAMRIMSGMDSSGDGSVDFEEFEAWWKNAPFTSMFASSNINR